jgi:endonuclease YncB( thermonuclease family)
LAITAGVDHLAGRPGDDWARYNHRSVVVSAAPTGNAIRLHDGTTVRLLGIADPNPDAVPWLTANVVGHHVTLLLPTVGTRDPAGRLLAYAYLDDVTCVNVALAHEGLAYADRRSADVMAGLIDAAEDDARRKKRGLWAGLRFDQMPAWRQAWLRARSAGK